jgi:hypothetical protein
LFESGLLLPRGTTTSRQTSRAGLTPALLTGSEQALYIHQTTTESLTSTFIWYKERHLNSANGGNAANQFDTAHVLASNRQKHSPSPSAYSMSEAAIRGPLDQTEAIQSATNELFQLNNQLAELRGRFFGHKQSQVTHPAVHNDRNAAQGLLTQVQQQLTTSQQRCQRIGKALASEVRSHGLTKAREEQATDALQAQQEALSSTLASLASAQQQLSNSHAEAAFLQEQLTAARRVSAKQQHRATAEVSALQQALNSTNLQLQQAREGAAKALVTAGADRFAAARAQAECTASQQQLDLMCQQRSAAAAVAAELSKQLHQVLMDKAMLQQVVAELSQKVCDLQAYSVTPSSLAPAAAPALTGQQECTTEELAFRQLSNVMKYKPSPDDIDADDEGLVAVSDQSVRCLQLQQHLSNDVCDTHPEQKEAQAAAVYGSAGSGAAGIISSSGTWGNLAAGDNSVSHDAAADAGMLPSPRALSRVWGSGLSTDNSHDSIDVEQQGFEGGACNPTKGSRCGSGSSADETVGMAGNSRCSWLKGNCDPAAVAMGSELCDGVNSSSCDTDSNCRWLQGSRAEVWTQTGFEPLLHGTAGKREVPWMEIIADMF